MLVLFVSGSHLLGFSGLLRMLFLLPVFTTLNVFYLSHLAKLRIPVCRGEIHVHYHFLSVLQACKNSNGVLWHNNDSIIPKQPNKIIIIILKKKDPKSPTLTAIPLPTKLYYVIPPRARGRYECFTSQALCSAGHHSWVSLNC